MANASQGLYSPLPQSISDSDSDKEIHSDGVRPKYSRKVQNGTHSSFDRINSSNGYMLANNMINLSEGKRGFTGMSLTRKCCFVFSIALCFMTIVIFLWVLPCSESRTCPVRVSNWENHYDDLEFKGRINVVNSSFKNKHNLALLYRRNISSSENNGGVISILGNNGAVAWYIPQAKTPSELNCYIIDVNADGIRDCLLLGQTGLEAINPISGEIFWHLHKPNLDNDDSTNLDFPIVLPDLNTDGINEMVTVMNGKTFRNKLIIICSKTGSILSTIELKHCLEVNLVKYESDVLIYLCKNGTDSRYYRIMFINLQNHVNNRSLEVLSTPITYNFTINLTTYELSNHKLVINNTGKCPECQTHITLLDTKTDIQLWYFARANCFATSPISFVFKSTEMNLSSLKGHTNGFILKLWQWVNYKPSRNMQSQNFEMPIEKQPNSSMQINLISERVVLITFNDSNVQVINVSQAEITQLCFPMEEDFVCQPDLMNQVESLVIADLDNDGSQELVSFSSTCINKKDSWNLVSNMKVLRLEAELPMLYEVAK